MVFFEAPHRLARTLAAMAEAFGADRRAAVCRELTKTYEEVRRGALAELVAWAADGVRGEVTLVVAGASGPVADLASQLEGIRERVVRGRAAQGRLRRRGRSHRPVQEGPVRRRDRPAPPLTRPASASRLSTGRISPLYRALTTSLP